MEVPPTKKNSGKRAMEARRWEDLPFDCLVFIFSKLGLEDLMLGVPLVCKSFHGASTDPECWKILNFYDIDFNPNSKFIARFKHEYRILDFSFNSILKLCSARSHGCATELSIPFILPSHLLAELILASIRCLRLKSLTLPASCPQVEEQIPRLVGKWKELETLELKWNPCLFSKIAQETRVNCPKVVKLGHNGYISYRDVAAIVKNFPGLKRLTLTTAFVLIEHGVVIFEVCCELRKVKLSWCRTDFISESCSVEESYVDRIHNFQ